MDDRVDAGLGLFAQRAVQEGPIHHTHRLLEVLRRLSVSPLQQ